MELLDQIAGVIDPAEFVTSKTGDGEKKRARARLNQIKMELDNLVGKYGFLEKELERIETKFLDKFKLYSPEVKQLLELLKPKEEDSPDVSSTNDKETPDE